MPLEILITELMSFSKLFLHTALCLVILAGTGNRSFGKDEKIDFVKDVRPIFEQHCYECHGADVQKSGFRLDIKSEAFKGGSGHAPDIVPGKPEGSPLVHFVRRDKDAELAMPPKGPPLSKENVATLISWIDQGAQWPDGIDSTTLEDKTDHWSFKPVVRPSVPEVKNSDWVANDIDPFILRRLEQNKLAPSEAASPETWLRRVTFDLTGLPPTPDELAELLASDSGNARGEVVERLLASPRYGERWAQHWLDVVRYADTSGFEVNLERPNAWPYRDYVIEAFNKDLPYDQFIREQLAGDALGENRGTGFLVTAAVLLPGQIGKDEASKRLARQDELTEILTNTSEAMLGLSIGCARCHDHKFDAISAKDFYSMQAFFSGVQFGERPDTDPEREKARLALRRKIEGYEKQISEFVPVAGPTIKRPSVNSIKNVERFAPVRSKKIRLTISSTIYDNKREPFIDELEVYNLAGENIALASRGATTRDSGNTGKSLPLVNNGEYGNASAWRAKDKGKGWVQIEFPKETEIDRIVWGRDRLGKFRDRLAVDYIIESTDGAGNKKVIIDSKDRVPYDSKAPLVEGIDAATLTSSEKKGFDRLLGVLKPLLEENGAGQAAMIYTGRFTQPEPVSLLRRGDPEQPLSLVQPAVLEAIDDIELPRESADKDRRLALADWIASPDNPLTARVMANRVWQWHFGIGLVETANDFGRAGTTPSHPELLDWLAAEFMKSGWSVKHLHRLIVLSSTYQQSAKVRPEASAVDGDARLLWRYPSRRLEAEAIRDSILAVSGRLNLETGGSGFNLFNKRGGLSGFSPVTVSDEKNRRRMIYAHKIRMEREAVFGAFDCPDAGQSQPRRRQSTTPVQALNLFNSQFTYDEANALAQEFESNGPDKPEDKIKAVWLRAYGRTPDSGEIADVLEVAAQHGWPAVFRAMFNSSEFVFLP